MNGGNLRRNRFSPPNGGYSSTVAPPLDKGEYRVGLVYEESLSCLSILNFSTSYCLTSPYARSFD